MVCEPRIAASILLINGWFLCLKKSLNVRWFLFAFPAGWRGSHVKLSLQPPPAASTSNKSNIPLPDYQQTLSLTCPPLLATPRFAARPAAFPRRTFARITAKLASFHFIPNRSQSSTFMASTVGWLSEKHDGTRAILYFTSAGAIQFSFSQESATMFCCSPAFVVSSSVFCLPLRMETSPTNHCLQSAPAPPTQSIHHQRLSDLWRCFCDIPLPSTHRQASMCR